MKTVGATLKEIGWDVDKIRINGRYYRKFPRSIKRLHVSMVWDYYGYDDFYGEDVKIVEIYTTKGR